MSFIISIFLFYLSCVVRWNDLLGYPYAPKLR